MKTSNLLLTLFTLFIGFFGSASGQIVLRGGELFEEVFTGARIEVQAAANTEGGHSRTLPGPDPVEAGKAGRLFFLNGDRLRAELQEFSRASGVVLTRGDLRAPLQFATRELFAFRAEAAPKPLAEGDTLVVLSNGDILHGRLLEMNGEHLSLRTAHSGDIRVARIMVESIWPRVGRQALYTWRGGLDGWEPNNTGAGGWEASPTLLQYLGQRQSSLSRPFKDLPEAWELDFAATWTAQLNFSLVLMARAAANSNQAWTLSMSGDTLRLYRNSPHHQELGRIQMNGLQERKKARFVVKVDTRRNTISLFVDDELVSSWSDPMGFKDAGEHLFFTGSGVPFNLHSLRVSRWNGTLPAAAPADTQGDLLEAANGDRYSGQVLSIAGDQVTFQGEIASFSAPLERFTHLALHPDSRGTPRKHAEDITLLLLNGDRLTLKPDALDEEFLRGESESYGTVQVKRQDIREIHFNIHDERRAGVTLN